MRGIRRVLAPNPGAFTLEGTNTWLVGDRPVIVIDPGPADVAHLESVASQAGRVEAILLTHHHPDHAPGAALLGRITGAPVLSFDPGSGEERLEDGGVVRVPGASLAAVHTPGHTADHLVFFDGESRAMFTGDAVLGTGTSVIDPPEGDLRAYIDSLSRMLSLGPGVLYPGHGPVVEDAPGKLRQYLAHRQDRERAVIAGLGAGPRTPSELVPQIYADYPPQVHPIAARSVLAHLLKLEAEGRVRRMGGPESETFVLESRPPRLP